MRWIGRRWFGLHGIPKLTAWAYIGVSNSDPARVWVAMGVARRPRAVRREYARTRRAYREQAPELTDGGRSSEFAREVQAEGAAQHHDEKHFTVPPRRKHRLLPKEKSSLGQRRHPGNHMIAQEARTPGMHATVFTKVHKTCPTLNPP